MDNATTFADLGLHEELLEAVARLGYEQPTPVQAQVIPHLVEGRGDLVALAQTGTGKTAAYALPLINRLVGRKPSKTPRALVLSPTRELCLQIESDMKAILGTTSQLRTLAVYGGASIEPQIRALRAGVDIVVATPGRIIDLVNRGEADLSRVKSLVLDEADEMLSMGFVDDLDALLPALPEGHQTLLFSATMSKGVERIASNYLTDATTIQVGSRNEGAENVNHVYYLVQAKDKYPALKRVVDYFPRIYAIIFCRTRMETQQVADLLIRDGYNAAALHGDLSQGQRDLAMQKFRHHRTQLLVATDVAARGLDVDDLTHVINYGMPDDVENYTHRSGRTGRAGKKGTSIVVAHVRDVSRIRIVEKVINKEFAKAQLPSPKEICTKQLYHAIDELEHTEISPDVEPFLAEAQKRWAWLSKEDIIARLLSREFGRFVAYYAKAPAIEEVVDRKQKGRRTGKRGFKPDDPNPPISQSSNKRQSRAPKKQYKKEAWSRRTPRKKK